MIVLESRLGKTETLNLLGGDGILRRISPSGNERRPAAEGQNPRITSSSGRASQVPQCRTNHKNAALISHKLSSFLFSILKVKKLRKIFSEKKKQFSIHFMFGGKKIFYFVFFVSRGKCEILDIFSHLPVAASREDCKGYSFSTDGFTIML